MTMNVMEVKATHPRVIWKNRPNQNLRFGIDPISYGMLAPLVTALAKWLCGETINIIENTAENLPSQEQLALRFQRDLERRLQECPANLSFKDWNCQQKPEKLGIKIGPLHKLVQRIQGKTEGEFLYNALFTYYKMTLPDLTALNLPQNASFRKLIVKEISFLEPTAQEFLKSFKDISPVLMTDPRISIIQDALRLAESRKNSRESQKIQILDSLSVISENPSTQVKILKHFISQDNAPEALTHLYKYQILSLAQFLSAKERAEIIEWLSPVCIGVPTVTKGVQFRRYLEETSFFENHKGALSKLIPMAGYLQSQLIDSRSYQMALFLNTKSSMKEAETLLQAYSKCFQRPLVKLSVPPSMDAINNTIAFLKSSEGTPKTLVIELPEQAPQLNQICTMFSNLYNKGTYVTRTQSYNAAEHSIIILLHENRKEILNSLIKERGLTEGFTSLTSRLGHGYHCP